MTKAPNRVNVVLGEEHAEKLRRLAERTHLSPGTLARSLLSAALDEADPSPANVTALLDAIDGAFESAQAGSRDFQDGRHVPLEEL